MGRIIDFISNKKNIKIVSKEIMKYIEKIETDENYDIDIKMKNGICELSKEPNTKFFFDPEKDSILFSLKEDLFSEELSEEIKGREKEFEKLYEIFIDDLKKDLIEHNLQNLRDKIRSFSFKDSSEEVIPLKYITISNIDIVNFSGSLEPLADRSIALGKNPSFEGSLDIPRILERLKELYISGVEIEDFMEHVKDEELFENVLEIRVSRKEFFDISIYLNVDYSFSENAINFQKKISKKIELENKK